MKVVYNEKFAEEMDRDSDVVRQRTRVASEVARTTKGMVPREHGDLRDSYSATRRGTHVYVRTNRIIGHMVEWGGGPFPPLAPIRRAALSSSLRVVEGGRK